nr:unnamed protein product [Digitaria exilis]
MSPTVADRVTHASAAAGAVPDVRASPAAVPASRAWRAVGVPVASPAAFSVARASACCRSSRLCLPCHRSTVIRASVATGVVADARASPASVARASTAGVPSRGRSHCFSYKIAHRLCMAACTTTTMNSSKPTCLASPHCLAFTERLCGADGQENHQGSDEVILQLRSNGQQLFSLLRFAARGRRLRLRRAEMGGVSWKRVELAALVLYALGFYLVVIQRSLRLSHDYSGKLYGLRAGSLAGHLNVRRTVVFILLISLINYSIVKAKSGFYRQLSGYIPMAHMLQF